MLFCSLIIVVGVLYPYFCNVQENQLKDELSLAASATEEIGISYLEGLEYSHYRLTLVSGDGTVLFDSHSDASLMENHADREEIRKALISGSGSSTRQSSTLTEKTIYEAVRLSDGSVLRISVRSATALYLVVGIIRPIVIVLLAAIILSSFLAHRLARKVVEPLNNLDLDNPLENEVYEELLPMLHRIHIQHSEIERQMIELKRKQDEFDQITGNMKEGLVLLDNRGRIISINPASRALFGTDNAFLGKDFVTICRKSNMLQTLEKAGKEGHADCRDRMDGKEYQFNINRIDTDGNSHGIVILAFDITEQVNAEKHRQEFTANVSHELKTPLQSIIGASELMENGIVKADDIPRFVGHIRKEASRLVFLIDDIIRLSELDEDSEMLSEDVCLKELSNEVCENLKDAAMLKGVSLDVCGEKGVVHGVRRLLYEVIYNLCDNAIKYNRTDGSVKVIVETDKDGVQLCVEDTGIGIPLEHQDKVFERFYRVDKSHSKKSGGTGLGLSIVKHAVLYHHGKISLESEIGKGTLITIHFSTKH